MIFLTVGTQLPFDRMVGAVDDWAGRVGRRDIFAQIGPTSFRPLHLEHSRFVTPAEFALRARAASMLIAHAGMGSILTALEYGKPIIIMPRLARLREQRNDHQIATCRRFDRTAGIHVANNENELVALLEDAEKLRAGSQIGPFASPELIGTLRAFIGSSHRTVAEASTSGHAPSRAIAPELQNS